MFYNNIDGWFDFEKFYSKIAENCSNRDILIEIGSWCGKSACFMAETLKKLKKYPKFYCIDNFEGSYNEPEHKNYIKSIGGPNQLLIKFLNNINTAKVSKYIHTLKMTSEEASLLFDNEEVNFVFIDASHDYDSVNKDIQLWKPKIKKGGILAGHDIAWNPVESAVLNNFKEYTREGSCWLVPI